MMPLLETLKRFQSHHATSTINLTHRAADKRKEGNRRREKLAKAARKKNRRK